MSINGWKEVKIGEVVEINKNSYSFKDNWDFINYLDTGNITENKINSLQLLHRDRDKIPSRAKRKVSMNDIIYSTVRPNQKHYGILKKPVDNMLVSTGFAVITGKPFTADNGFLYYYLTQQHIVELLHTIGEHSTSAYPSIKPSDIESLNVLLPPFDEQKALATTLSCLDDKIELNNRINKNLEEIAQAIFKSWFVDFEPFQDGEFEDSELGRIPKGWRVGFLEEVAMQINLVCRRSEIPNRSRYVGLEHISRKRLIINKFGYIEDVASDKLRFNKYEVLFGKIRPYFHKVAIAPWDGYCSTDAIVIAPRIEEFYGYTALTLYSDLFVQFAVHVSQGTKMPRAEWKILKNFKMVIPPFEVIENFNSWCLPFIEEMIINYEQNSNLTQLRDTLLPKLMSGEIRVPIEEVQ